MVSNTNTHTHTQSHTIARGLYSGAGGVERCDLFFLHNY